MSEGFGMFLSCQDCARMRVGDKWQAWEDGEVLFFDDSFEHEVVNDCDRER